MPIDKTLNDFSDEKKTVDHDDQSLFYDVCEPSNHTDYFSGKEDSLENYQLSDVQKEQLKALMSFVKAVSQYKDDDIELRVSLKPSDGGDFVLIARHTEHDVSVSYEFIVGEAECVYERCKGQYVKHITDDELEEFGYNVIDTRDSSAFIKTKGMIKLVGKSQEGRMPYMFDMTTYNRQTLEEDGYIQLSRIWAQEGKCLKIDTDRAGPPPISGVLELNWLITKDMVQLVYDKIRGQAVTDEIKALAPDFS